MDTSPVPDSGASSTGGAANGGAGAGGGGAGTSGKGGTGGAAGSGTAGSGTAGAGNAAGSGTAGSGTAGSGTAGSGTAGSAGAGGAPATSGTIPLTLTADGGAASNAVVSLGVPFPPGALADPSLIRVLDAKGAEVAAHVATLATWPQDGSLRSALVAFHASLASGASAGYQIAYGAPRTQSEPTLAANPDGPVTATLAPDWYATSRVIGFQIPASKNTAFPAWETEIEGYLSKMSPGWETYGKSCGTTSKERTYYDGPHALFQRFIHRGTAASYRRARLEATWYRKNELAWYEGNTVAIYDCQTWNPSAPLDWGTVRRMLGQGMLDDYLLTGDPTALAALRGLGEAFRKNVPALTTGKEITVKVTERNMAWPMMGLASYYAVDHDAGVLSALQKLVDMTVAWQGEGTSGAFEHDINRPDPDECEVGPKGGSPFMTSLLIDGLMDTYLLTGDAKIPPVIVKAATWYKNDAVTSDGIGFRYLWGCDTDPYDDSGYADLNLLISHVFGAAYYASGDTSWLTFGDTMANHGIDNIYAGAPKQWSQSTRGFLKYMGYRSLALSPLLGSVPPARAVPTGRRAGRSLGRAPRRFVRPFALSTTLASRPPPR